MLIKLKTGRTAPVVLPSSEVCLHMGIAGKRALVHRLNERMVQIYIDDKKYSAPVLCSEAGVNYDD